MYQLLPCTALYLSGAFQVDLITLFQFSNGASSGCTFEVTNGNLSLLLLKGQPNGPEGSWKPLQRALHQVKPSAAPGHLQLQLACVTSQHRRNS